ncbi:MAG: hypothetical protein JNK21_07720, partial [Rhodospirillaceae bacterium]|nr:hypothetical protein [Rhodospirillaceae bacterium]
MHQSILVYRSHLYLKIAFVAVLLSVMAYVIHNPLGQPNGGTWLGYTLGAVSGGLMIWLAWFGVRKRMYGIGRVRLEDWLSAHVYLGLALAVISTLHAGFQVGWNVHTALYVLMLIVIVSGIFGVYFYVRFPLLLTENRRGMTTEIMLTQIADLDREIRQLAMGLDDETNTMVLKATQDEVIGKTLFAQLRGDDADCATTAARAFVERSASSGEDTRRRQL